MAAGAVRIGRLSKAPPEQRVSRCSVTMSRALADRKSPLGKLLRAKYSRGNLTRWSHGQRYPELEAAVTMEKISKGALPVRGWFQAPVPCKACGTPQV